jgi:nucleotide-binding universal stress UspA family protein
MEESKKPIIVPWGLTMMSEIAFQFASDIAKVTGHSITLVKIVKSEGLRTEAERDLAEVAVELEKKYGVKPDYKVSEGSIYKRFTEIADELNSPMIIKHTSAVTGMDKIIGGKSIKIIAGSKIPYLVVQKAPIRPKIEKVLIPLDYTKESKEKMNWVSYLSRFFKFKAYIVTPSTTDDRKMRFIKNNLVFAKHIMEERGIDYEISTCDGKKDFADEFVNCAHNLDVDLIFIMLPRDFGFSNLLFGSKEQDVIVNQYGIPVMCINPRDDLRITGWK